MSSSIHFPDPSDDEAARTEEFLAQLREFLDTVDGSVIERDAQIPDEYVKGLAELGCFGMKIPSEYGGLNMSQVAYNRALMMVSTVHASLGALLSAHQSIGVPEPLKLAGTEEQKRKFLPRCAAGAISAFLLTEPDVGSDPARLASTATPVDGGAAYELDGVKLWTTNGVVAELLVVMATRAQQRRAPRRNQRVRRRGRLTRHHRGAAQQVHGIARDRKRSDQAAPGPGARREPDRPGRRRPEDRADHAERRRLSIPAIAAGSAKWSLKIAREWSGERVQWGKPVGEHGAVAEKISFMAATSYALESVLELSGQMADEGRNDIRIEAALAKLWSSEMACVIADDLLQIRGGRGYETAESLAARGERAVPVEQVVRDLRINRIFEGSSEIMRLLIAREAVDAHLSAAGDLANPKADVRQKAKAAVGASGFYAKWLPQLVFGEGQRPTAYREFGNLATHLRFVERSARKLARNTFYGMARWQAAMEQKQGFLGRVVDIGAELFAMAADVCAGRGSASCGSGPRSAVLRVGRGVLSAGDPAGGGAVRGVMDQHRWHRCGAGAQRAQRPLHLAGRRDRRPVRGHRAVDRHWEAGASTEADLARRFLTVART